MPDPFTFSFIVISFALHIGHIGYTIYKDTPTTIIKEENVKEEEEEEEEEEVVKKPTQYDAEFKNTVKIIKSFEIPQLITDDDYADDESSILTCRHVKIRTH
jgi:hypothetical protein